MRVHRVALAAGDSATLAVLDLSFPCARLVFEGFEWWDWIWAHLIGAKLHSHGGGGGIVATLTLPRQGAGDQPFRKSLTFFMIDDLYYI